MSHFSTLKTKIVDRNLLLKALAACGFKPTPGPTEIRGYANQATTVDFSIPSDTEGYDIGFVQSDDGYEIVADWWCIGGDTVRNELQRRMACAYAEVATDEQLQQQGLRLLTRVEDEHGRVQLLYADHD